MERQQLVGAGFRVEGEVRAGDVWKRLSRGGWFTTAGGTAATNIPAEREQLERPGLGDRQLNVGTGGVGRRRMRGCLRDGGRRPRYRQMERGSWSTLDSGIKDRRVRGGLAGVALAVSGSNVFAGLVHDGRQAAANIAKWDGDWSALGSGLNDVNALAVLATLYGRQLAAAVQR